MLKFYQDQLMLQNILVIFLDIYPPEYPSKATLMALTKLQIDRVTFIIQELENPSSLLGALCNAYYVAYAVQQKLLAPIVTPEYLATYLPPIEFTSIQPAEKVLDQHVIEPQPEASQSYSNVRLSEYLMDYPAVSFFPAPPAKLDQNPKATDDKYRVYAERLEHLKTKGSQESLSPEEKREARLLSKKLSSHDSRVRKKVYRKELEDSLVENRTKNEELREQCTQLLVEQRGLKEIRSNLFALFTSAGIDPERILAQRPMTPVMTTSSSLEEEHRYFQIP